MKIINDFRVEKEPALNVWVAFKKEGISAWFEVHREKKFSDLKKWCKDQTQSKKKNKNG